MTNENDEDYEDEEGEDVAFVAGWSVVAILVGVAVFLVAFF